MPDHIMQEPRVLMSARLRGDKYFYLFFRGEPTARDLRAVEKLLTMTREFQEEWEADQAQAASTKGEEAPDA